MSIRTGPIDGHDSASGPGDAPTLTASRRWLGPACSAAIDLAAVAVLFLRSLRFPAEPAGNQLDLGWAQALGEFLLAGAQAGVDYVFTFGPLGYFYWSAYNAVLYWHAYAWALGMASFTAVVTVLTARRIRALELRILFYAIALIYVSFLIDVGQMFVIVESALLLFFSGRWRSWVLVAVLPFLAALSLEKFTCAMTAGTALTLVSANRWLETRSMKALAPLGGYIAAVASLWLLLGQRLAHLPIFVRNSLEVAAGYAAGMSLESVSSTFSCALLIFAVNLVLCAALALRRPFASSRCSFALLALFVLFVQWKHGYVRDDMHILGFLLYGTAAPLLLIAADPEFLSSRGARLGLGAAMLLSVDCTDGAWASHYSQDWDRCWKALTHNAHVLNHPRHYRALLEQIRNRTELEWQLPNIRERVGNETIDVISPEQGVLFLNRLHWSPRPIFQGYSAYTERFVRLNADHFRGPAAPRFVLLSFCAIDNRFPTHEDGGVVLELLKRYRPVLWERHFLLLENHLSGADSELETPAQVTRRAIRFGEEIAVPPQAGGFVTLALNVQMTRSGKLLQAVYRPPVVRLNLVLADGEKRSFRLIPEMARSPFLLSPFILNAQDFSGLYGVQVGKRIVSFSIATDDLELLGRRAYRREIEATFTTSPLAPIRAWYSRTNTSNRGI